MLIRILLLAGIGGVAYYAFLRRSRLPLNLLVIMGLLATAAVFVIWPGLSDAVAHLVGVGRGADLVNYFVQLTMLFVALHYWTKFVALRMELATIVREMAFLRERIARAAGEDSPPTHPVLGGSPDAMR